jgi:hypothetical protein
MVYTIDDFGFEEEGAVVGFAGEFINHTCFKIPPDSQLGDSAMQEIRGLDFGKTRTQRVLGGHSVVDTVGVGGEQEEGPF